MHDDPGAHGHDFDELEQESDLINSDVVILTSVGIDVGTATSQIMFSRLTLQRLGAELSSRFVVVDRETLYLSPIHLTPYAGNRERIDDQALGRLVDDSYAQAGLKPENVDTGAIILTGEAIRRDNARAIADLFASQRGDFVCATAGHHFEALLAAHGSGTAALTEGNDKTILNIDIGGGTTKLAVARGGKVLQTAAFHIGGRLLATDDDGRIRILEPGGQTIARHAGFDWKVGDNVTSDQVDQMAGWMANAVLTAVGKDPLPKEIAELFLTPELTIKDFDGVVFSGGVGEYVYAKEKQSYGDLGRPLGDAIRKRTSGSMFRWPLLPAKECIRATVVGASQYSVQVSGNTIYTSDPAKLLPLRNLQVLRPTCDLSGDIVPDEVAKAITAHYTRFDLREGESNVALVFEWQGDASFRRLDAFLEGLVRGIPQTLTNGRPIVLVWDHDVGGIVGANLKEERKVDNEVLSIDGIVLRDFDFIDVGHVLEPSGTVPVTIKSLVFQM
jgi:ethanolamine utilization protein EutA